jgi:SAM-dependent methyltransferase
MAFPLKTLDGDTVPGEWFEDEEFWVRYAPLMFDENRWAEVPDCVDKLVALSGISPGGRVLDACCGVGRHSLEFASRGFKVTGVDITSAFLDAASESAESAGLEIDFKRADIRHFSRHQSFDLCIDLYTSFGYFDDASDDSAVLRNFADNLVPGGSLVIETLGKEVAARDFAPREEFMRAGWKVTAEYSVIGPWESMRNRWILENEVERVDRSFILRLYSGVEMERALRAAGFAEVSILGGLDGSPYDDKAESLVALAKL